MSFSQARSKTVAMKTPSPERTPRGGVGKARQPIITAAQKQALIENLQLEGNLISASRTERWSNRRVSYGPSPKATINIRSACTRPSIASRDAREPYSSGASFDQHPGPDSPIRRGDVYPSQITV
jgi:hypothetical protein